jgi:hypothetical protein
MSWLEQHDDLHLSSADLNDHFLDHNYWSKHSEHYEDISYQFNPSCGTQFSPLAFFSFKKSYKPKKPCYWYDASG